jgi:hypothetical protein
MLYLYSLSAGPVVSCLNSSSKLLSRSGVHELIVQYIIIHPSFDLFQITTYLTIQVQSTGREETCQVRRERELCRDELRQELKKMQF